MSQLGSHPRIPITSGPSLRDLELGLFYGSFSSNNRHPVQFVIRDRSNPIEVIIDGVERENGSGESWLFRGNTHNWVEGKTLIVHGWFRTDRRVGWIQVSDGAIRLKRPHQMSRELTTPTC